MIYQYFVVLVCISTFPVFSYRYSDIAGPHMRGIHCKHCTFDISHYRSLIISISLFSTASQFRHLLRFHQRYHSTFELNGRSNTLTYLEFKYRVEK